MRYSSIGSPETLLPEAAQENVSAGIYTTQSADEVLTFNTAVEKIKITAIGAALAIKINNSAAIIPIATTVPFESDNFQIKRITVTGDAGQQIGFYGWVGGLGR